VTTTAYERVTDRLRAVTGYTPNGSKEWRCPAHEDEKPSLSVTYENGRVLAHCFAGCDLDDVLRAIDLSSSDLFDEPAERVIDDRPQIVDTYDYVDETGALLYQEVRYFPKDFRVRRPDGNGGWIWNLNDCRRVLYRLPELLEAMRTGRTIFVTEGAKDADALIEAGEVATTNALGAGKWRAEYTETLNGAAEVVVVTDRDEPGYKHARQVAKALQPVVGNLLIAEPKEGKDVADHLAAGYNPDELLAVIDAEEPKDSPPINSYSAEWGLEPIDWAAFWARPAKDAEWAFEPIVPMGRGTAIYSTAKTGKSLLSLDIVAAAASGRSVLGQPPREPMRVLYLDMEMTADDLRERLEDLGYGASDDLNGLAYYQLPSLPPLDTELGGEVFLGLVQAHGAQAVVIDTMARAVAGEENSSDTYRDFYRHTGQRLKAQGVSLLRLDHAGKDIGKGQRGASSKADDVDVVFRLTAVSGSRFTLTRTHTRVPWIPAEISINRLEEPHLHHVVATETSWPAGTGEIAVLLDDLSVPLDATVTTAVKALKDGGQGKRRAIVIEALKFRKSRP
jgi:5S rRNA maturation endonuclease (ribonuclease M5)/KaiC/GvpD/RAD55 family RecA-like ATPase